MSIQYMAQNNKNYIFSLLTVSVISQLILLSFPSLFNDNTTPLLTTADLWSEY